MGALAIMVLAFAGYIIVYQLYGKFIGAKIFALSGAARTPSVEMEDGVDYVPTKKEIIFGHHFTSIAGTGPLVGPAIAVIWGWVPAIIWVFVGSIVMGAVHDFGALIISMRNQGKSISEYTAKYVNNRTKVFFFLIVFLELWIVIAIFGLVIAIVFAMYPNSVLPVWLEIPIAIYLGYLIYKKGANVALWSIIAVIALYVTVVIGAYVPIKLPTIAGIPATGGWTIILLIYAFIASTLPVTTLLQPRDFINSHQLVVAMALLVLGVLFAGFGGRLDIVAPAVQLSPAKSPPMWPFLFITIACGAISGFHSLVSSGTSAKQVRDEQDSLFVGYGSMLLEGALATLVIIAVSAGIGMAYTTKAGETLTGVAAWTAHYASWASAGGLGNAVRALVDGSANMIRFPRYFQTYCRGDYGGICGFLCRNHPGYGHPNPALCDLRAVRRPQPESIDQPLCCHLCCSRISSDIGVCNRCQWKRCHEIVAVIRCHQPDPGFSGINYYHPVSEAPWWGKMGDFRNPGRFYGSHDHLGSNSEPG
jgi:carbon starvation protein